MIGKCLFPVAGYGTRFLPATKSMPKEMLPIVNKPLVQYGVEEAIEAGMTNCAFVTGRGKRAIADHFDTSYELEHQIAGSTKEQHLEGIREGNGERRLYDRAAAEHAGVGSCHSHW
jgi:UTP--glucose-1-phosphate uridylyltransferase